MLVKSGETSDKSLIQEDSLELLGLFIDKYLSWGYHKNSLLKKLSSMNYAIFSSGENFHTLLKLCLINSKWQSGYCAVEIVIKFQYLTSESSAQFLVLIQENLVDHILQTIISRQFFINSFWKRVCMYIKTLMNVKLVVT